MSYPKDLDEYDEGELLAEVATRQTARRLGQCDYCYRPRDTEPCKMETRHAGEPARNWLAVFAELELERERQEQKFPHQHLANGTDQIYALERDEAQRLTNEASAAGTVTWKHVLAEEVLEAFAEENDQALRAELVQICAVGARWIEDIDSRPRP